MKCPGATLSTGFTTGLGLFGHYTDQIMADMYDKLVEKRTTAPVTIPIRASLGARSVTEISQFMARADHDALFPVSLTIWSAALDLVDMEGLESLVLEVGKDRVFVDVPWDYNSPQRSLADNQPSQSFLSSKLNFVINFLHLIF